MAAELDQVLQPYVEEEEEQSAQFETNGDLRGDDVAIAEEEEPPPQPQNEEYTRPASKISFQPEKGCRFSVPMIEDCTNLKQSFSFPR